MTGWTLNDYGDKHRDTTGRHGTDIASQRIDDLDRRCLLDILNGVLDRGVALDVGCGSGYHGLRMASLGCPTILIDLLDMSERVRAIKASFPDLNVSYYHGPIEKFLLSYREANISAFYSQRTIHYMTFQESVNILTQARKILNKRSKVYISASGLNSELGAGYGHAARDVRERFSDLSAEMAQKHSIGEKVCLYTEKDVELLAKLSGFHVDEVWSSRFGNVKAILISS